MHIESILRRIHPLPGFVYDNVRWSGGRARPHLLVCVRPRQRSRGICSTCFKKRPGYDTLCERRFAFVPLWGLVLSPALFRSRIVRQCRDARGAVFRSGPSARVA